MFIVGLQWNVLVRLGFLDVCGALLGRVAFGGAVGEAG